MKIKIYEETKEEKKVEKPVYFRLMDGYEGEIDLIVVDEGGADVGGGILLSIQPEGNILLRYGLSPEIGLKVTDAGFIKVETKRT